MYYLAWLLRFSNIKIENVLSDPVVHFLNNIEVEDILSDSAIENFKISRLIMFHETHLRNSKFSR